MSVHALLGQTVAGYRIVRLLSEEGGMGLTFVGEKPGGRAVIKKARQGEEEQLYREAKFLAGLKHPRLPRVLDFSSGLMIMELVEGDTVEADIERRKATSGWNEQEDYLGTVVDWCLQMADVLHYLHSFRPRPILHRDIKAKNVLVRPSGQLCLIDFGIARFYDEAKHEAGLGDTVAYFTAGWTAPEFEATRQTTPRSDLYMLGVLLHFWLSGEQPDDNEDKHRRKPLTPLPRKPRPALWDPLVAVSERLRHLLPEQRHADARELAAELKKLGGGAEAGPTTRACPQCRADVRTSCRFCPVCGGRLTRAVEQPASTVTVTVQFAPEHADARAAVLRAAEDGRPAPLDRFRVYQRLRELEQDPGFSELVSLESLPNVEQLSYQVEGVKTALQRMRGWCLLADEVGLGKTIEAGIIIKELMQRQLARRILILAPRDLCTQWQQELFDKFDLFFLVFGKDVDYSLAWQCDRVIAPYRVAEDRFHRQELLGQKFDLVVMDEAHHLIMHDDQRGAGDQRRKLLHSFAKELRKGYFLMLSATPLHDDLQDLYELLTLLKPGSVGDFEDFKGRFMDPANPFKPRNVQELRRRLDEVMIRRPRRLIAELKFPRREAHRIAVALDPAAAELFGRFRAFVRDRLQGLARENRPLRHALQLLAESFHSSPAAFAGQCSDFLRRFRGLLPPDVGEQLRDFLGAVRPELLEGKVERAAEILRRVRASGGHNKVLVFSQYEDTAELLFRELGRRTGLPVVRYPGNEEADGGLKALEALHQLRTTAAAMVCTENASEGLNLQCANTMINFDLPWDPMKLEQRIGRIQRLGQVSDRVFIHNLFLRDTVEEDILGVLDEKLDMFGAAIGHVEEILGNLADDRNFDDAFLDLFLQDPDAHRQIDILVQQRETKEVDELLNSLFDNGPAVTAPLSRGETTPAGRPTAPARPPVAPITPAPTPAGGRPCAGCGQALPPGARFCDGCGRPAPASPPSAAATCAGCGRPLAARMRFCDNCGRPVSA